LEVLEGVLEREIVGVDMVSKQAVVDDLDSKSLYEHPFHDNYVDQAGSQMVVRHGQTELGRYFVFEL